MMIGSYRYREYQREKAQAELAKARSSMPSGREHNAEHCSAEGSGVAPSSISIELNYRLQMEWRCMFNNRKPHGSHTRFFGCYHPIPGSVAASVPAFAQIRQLTENLDGLRLAPFRRSTLRLMHR
jgi:hypothetical protein